MLCSPSLSRESNTEDCGCCSTVTLDHMSQSERVAVASFFLFADRLVIVQGTTCCQTHRGEAAKKSITHYREVGIQLFGVTFQLSALGAFPLSSSLPFHPHPFKLQQKKKKKKKSILSRLSSHINMSFIFSRCISRTPFVSLVQTSCAAPRSPEAGTLTSQRNASQEVVLSAVFVGALRGDEETWVFHNLISRPIYAPCSAEGAKAGD